jgi:hypothetical protein
VSRVTEWGSKIETPDSGAPANLALQLQRIAEQTENAFVELQHWSNFMSWSSLLSDGGEVGTPALVRSLSADQTGVQLARELAVSWNSTLYNNTGVTPTNGDFVIPEQEQRYWWWMGCHIIMQPGVVNTRYTTRMYVQDRDPTTGQVLTGFYRYNQYMVGSGSQFIVFDGLFRTGGGRQKVGIVHNYLPNALNLVAGSFMWAVRISPDR